MKKIYVYFFLFYFIIMGCAKHSTVIIKTTQKEENNAKKELVLERIKAMTNCNGKGVDVELRQSNQEPFKESIWVYHGECVIMSHVYETDDKVPVPTQCKFMINKNLDFATEGEWDGKYLGARGIRSSAP
jgi:hypothetical protein